MISVLLFTLLVAVLIFFYMRHTARRRKKRSADLNSVRDFHESYTASKPAGSCVTVTAATRHM